MAKVAIPTSARGLWRQVLVSDVLVPIWEAESAREAGKTESVVKDVDPLYSPPAESPFSDIKILLNLGLVKIKVGVYPKCLVVLADCKMALSDSEKLVMVSLTGAGMTREELITWAHEKNVVAPLNLIKNLMNLDVVGTKTEDGLLKFVLK